MNIIIRQASIKDSKSISDLIMPLAEKYVCPTIEAHCTEFLLAAMSEQKIVEYIQSGFDYVVAVTEHNDIVGVASIIDTRHLYHLFVDDDYQGLGLSRALWDIVKRRALEQGNSGHFTVNSALNAEPVYLRFGFQRIDGIRNRNGMIDIPMYLDCE